MGAETQSICFSLSFLLSKKVLSVGLKGMQDHISHPPSASACLKFPHLDNKGWISAFIWPKPLQVIFTPPGWKKKNLLWWKNHVLSKRMSAHALCNPSAVSATLLSPSSSLLDVYQIQQSGKTCPAELPCPPFLRARWGQHPSNMQMVLTFL